MLIETTTTVMSITTTTTKIKKLFEVYWLVISSTNRDRVILRFAEGKVELRVTLDDGKALEGSADYQRGDSFLWRIYEYLLRVTKGSSL